MLPFHRPTTVRTLFVSALPFVSALAFAGCHVSMGSSSSPAHPPAGPAAHAAPGPDAHVAEAFRPRRPRQTGAMPLFLPGSRDQQVVRYDVVDGVAVMEGDIMLGPIEQLAMRYGIPWAPPTNVRSAVATANRSHLWPGAEIPYVIDGSVSQQMRGYIQWAIEHLATTALQLRPRTSADRDYVVFNDAGSGCSSYVGRIGGAQDIQLEDGCGRGSVVHEILHAAGFYHEQSRSDRDQFITIVWDEIDPAFRSNFEKRSGLDIGPYDYGSIMHYSSRAFSRSGRPTLIPTTPNVTIGQREGLSANDRAAIASLYGTGAPPSPGGPPAAPPPATPAPPPAAPAPAPAPAANASFAGEYTSARGSVSCTQSGMTVTCRYPGGSMLCGANGHQLNCGWSGGGQGRAMFERQPSGVLAGTFGDFLSSNSRGEWSLTPVASGGGAAAPQAPPPASPAPPPASPAPPPAQPPAQGAAPLAGTYASTRGPMTCSEAATSLSCTFTESGASGRLDCQKDASGTSLSCTWMTFLPRPATGRATFTRTSPSERSLTGTWGHFAAATGGGTWEMTGQ